MRIDPDDGARIAAAVTAAERITDGEVVVIVARRSDAYHDVAAYWAVAAMLALVAIVAAVPGHFAGSFDRLAGGWEEGLSSGQSLTILLAALLLTFLLVRGLLAIAPLRLALTPRAITARRVRRRAIEHFRSGIEARTATRTGVLLYLSLAERRAELVADRAIAERVPGATWGATMAALVTHLRAGRAGDGVVEAVTRIGAVLAEHFPHSGTDPNELPDGVILL